MTFKVQRRRHELADLAKIVALGARADDKAFRKAVKELEEPWP